MSERAPGIAPHVLVVDDDDAIRTFVADALAGVGYRVAEASDGLHALARLDVDPPDLVLLDMRMPNLDGWGFMAAVAGRRSTRRSS